MWSTFQVFPRVLHRLCSPRAYSVIASSRAPLRAIGEVAQPLVGGLRAQLQQPLSCGAGSSSCVVGDDLAGWQQLHLPWFEPERGLVDWSEGERPLGCGTGGTLQAMNRNAREGTRANHGKRPCSNRRRRRAARKRLSDHPFLPLKNKQPKGSDF